MFNKTISQRLGFYSVVGGLICGLSLFPNQTFEKSILVGNLLPVDSFPNWISNALLFWSFVFATIIPMLIILIFIKRNKDFDFNKIRKVIKNIN